MLHADILEAERAQTLAHAADVTVGVERIADRFYVRHERVSWTTTATDVIL